MKTQKELKAMYLDELVNKSTWRNDQHMIDWSFKRASVIVDLPSWWLFIINKPHIQTSFCFWYSDDYDGSDFDRACDMEDHARKSEKYFINQNLDEINYWINKLREAKENENNRNDRWEKLYILKHEHSGDADDCALRSIEWVWYYDYELEKNRLERLWDSLTEASKKDIDAILEWYEKARDLFQKRLSTYLKRFWLSKLHTWTYWRDE